MSADNFVGIRPQKVNGQLTGKYEIFEYGNMSTYEEDCMYLANSVPTCSAATRTKAIVAAHDIVNNMDICEYGVVEMPPIPDEPCGRCYMCVHERSIVADSIERCRECGNPIANSEWQTFRYDRENNKVEPIHVSCEKR